jgi:hypothetical protein
MKPLEKGRERERFGGFRDSWVRVETPIIAEETLAFSQEIKKLGGQYDAIRANGLDEKEAATIIKESWRTLGIQSEYETIKAAMEDSE